MPPLHPNEQGCPKCTYLFDWDIEDLFNRAHTAHRKENILEVAQIGQFLSPHSAHRREASGLCPISILPYLGCSYAMLVLLFGDCAFAWHLETSYNSTTTVVSLTVWISGAAVFFFHRRLDLARSNNEPFC
jgi:hypothetical protein